MSAEIVIGIVGAIGTDLDGVMETLTSEFGRVKYDAKQIRLSAELVRFCRLETSIKPLNADERIELLMTAGDDVRRAADRGDAVALLGIAKLCQIRESLTGDKQKPAARTAYIFRSLKRREEVRTLRELYGNQFCLISVFSTRSRRRQVLSQRIAKSRGSYNVDEFNDAAERLIERDRYDSRTPLGQDVETTFPEADLFVNGSDLAETKSQVSRFIELVFGHPYITPTTEEYGMFHARAAAMRTADLSRQVGAVITTNSGEILTSGCNEVPRAEGGADWSNVAGSDDDFRDYRIGYDSTSKMKFEILAEVFRGIHSWLLPHLNALDPQALVRKALYDEPRPPLKGTRADNLLEFGRIVHAEMGAITEAARRGVAIKGSQLFCTTFPCHMCARHIISSGIKKVIYIEPYPKSLAKDLYGTMISVDNEPALPSAVSFTPFVGVAPRRFLDLFQAGTRKDRHGQSVVWDPSRADFKLVVQSVAQEQVELGFMAVVEDCRKEYQKR